MLLEANELDEAMEVADGEGEELAQTGIPAGGATAIMEMSSMLKRPIPLDVLELVVVLIVSLCEFPTTL